MKGQRPNLGLVALLSVSALALANCSRPDLSTAETGPIAIDKSEIDLAFQRMFFKSTTPSTNREWNCFLLEKSSPLSEDSQRQMAAAFWNRPVSITDGTNLLATGHISSAIWDMTRRFAGYTILFDSSETIVALERKLGIEHPELPMAPPPAERLPAESRP